MKLKELLIEIDKSCNDIPFTSDYLAIKLSRPTKEISNSLGRLYRLGYLKRQKIKRECFVRKKGLCKRGYCYEYQLSKKGKEYLRWLAIDKPSKDMIFIELINALRSRLPDHQAKILEASVWAEVTDKSKKLVGAGKPQDIGTGGAIALLSLCILLVNENEMLRKENRELKDFVEYLCRELGFYIGKDAISQQQTRSTIIDYNDIIASVSDLLNDFSVTRNDIANSIVVKLVELLAISRNKCDLMLLLLAKYVPRDELVKFFEFIHDYENKALQMMK
ncbi:MAG: hypothetical protein QW087_07715 [Methanomassiliicoccales archaeon]